MFDLLKKVIRPLATAAVVTFGVLAAAWMTNERNQMEYPFDPFATYQDFNPNTEKQKVVLRAADLRQLRWMSVSQLKLIFNEGRRGQIQIESSPMAYQELRWMSNEQIKAIFGTDDSNR